MSQAGSAGTTNPYSSRRVGRRGRGRDQLSRRHWSSGDSLGRRGERAAAKPARRAPSGQRCAAVDHRSGWHKNHLPIAGARRHRESESLADAVVPPGWGCRVGQGPRRDSHVFPSFLPIRTPACALSGWLLSWLAACRFAELGRGHGLVVVGRVILLLDTLQYWFLLVDTT